MRDENDIPMGHDLIWRGVEITTGAMREHRYDVLVNKPKGLAMMLNSPGVFKYGCSPHGSLAWVWTD